MKHLLLIIPFMLYLYSPTVLVAQEVKVKELEQRVGQLEQIILQLENRITKLENQLAERKEQGLPISKSEKWKNISNWRKLKLGMKESDVRKLLGEPDKVDVSPGITFWYWDYPRGPKVILNSRSGKLESWSEPD